MGQDQSLPATAQQIKDDLVSRLSMTEIMWQFDLPYSDLIRANGSRTRSQATGFKNAADLE